MNESEVSVNRVTYMFMDVSLMFERMVFSRFTQVRLRVLHFNALSRFRRFIHSRRMRIR